MVGRFLQFNSHIESLPYYIFSSLEQFIITLDCSIKKMAEKIRIGDSDYSNLRFSMRWAEDKITGIKKSPRH